MSSLDITTIKKRKIKTAFSPPPLYLFFLILTIMIFCVYFAIIYNSLLGKERIETLTTEQKPFARDDDNEMSLVNVISKYKPTILIGVTAVGGLFTEDIIREMKKHAERPIIFPLSNPTTKAECTAEQAYEWTDGTCIFASGSPFDPIELSDGSLYYTSQCNNSKYLHFVFLFLLLGCIVAVRFGLVFMVVVCLFFLFQFGVRCQNYYYYFSLLTNTKHPTFLSFITIPKILCTIVYVFPGVGLGATLCGAKRITDRMLYIAAKALAESVPTPSSKDDDDDGPNGQEHDRTGQVFPHISQIRQVSHKIAVEVIREAISSGVATTKISKEDELDLNSYVARKMYYPEYVPLVEKRALEN